MKSKVIPYIPYRNFGYGMSCNLVISFLTMYPETKVSNKYLSNKLDISIRQITRIISDIEERKIISVEYPSSKTRKIKLLKSTEELLSNDRQNVHQVIDKMSTISNETQTEMIDKMSTSDRQNDYQVMDNMSMVIDKMSTSDGQYVHHMIDKMSNNNKSHNKSDELPHNKPSYELLDNIPKITSKDILQDILKSMTL
jgi:hypothetical protein